MASILEKLLNRLSSEQNNRMPDIDIPLEEAHYLLAQNPISPESALALQALRNGESDTNPKTKH